MPRPSGSREQHGLLPVVSAPKEEKDTSLKRPLDQGVIKNIAITPKFHKFGKRFSVEAEKRKRKERIAHMHETRPHKSPQESSQGTLMSSKRPHQHSIMPYTPVTWQQQSVISFSPEPRGPYVRPKRYSSVIVQNRAISGPHLQPQVPNTNKQDPIAAALEWKRKLEAAEALLALRNSPMPPPASAFAQQGVNMPNSYIPGHGPQGSAGARGLHRNSPYLPPQSANSFSLTGSLDCMSFFT